MSGLLYNLKLMSCGNLFSRALPIGLLVCIPIFYKIQVASKKADMGNKNKKADAHH